MYLLDALSREMSGEKRELGLQLLNEPLQCNPGLMRRWISQDLCYFFDLTQTQCRRDLHRNKRRPAHLRMGGLRVVVTAFLDDNETSLDNYARLFVDQICARVREDLARKQATCDDLSIAAKTSLFLLYALADLLFLILFDAVKYSDGRFSITNDAGLLRSLRLYFFGHQLAMDSHFADAIAHAMLLKKAADSHASLHEWFRQNHDEVELLVDNAMDKFFSCHPLYIDMLRPNGANAIINLRRRCRLICYLHLRASQPLGAAMENGEYDPWVGHVTTTITNEELSCAGFSDAEVKSLLEMSALHPPDEQLLRAGADGRYSVAAWNLKYALVAYSLDFFDSNSGYGTWFEEDYIFCYVQQRLQSNRYALLRGFKPNNDPEKYDVDAMIFDRRLERLYFLQIKHRSRTVFPFLRDELKEFSMGKPFATAVRQLKAVRDNLGSQKLLDRVKSRFSEGGFNARRIDAKYLQQHSGFLIIHSVENFDFGVKDGCAMYEWNTFRSLLKEEVMRHVDDVVHPVRIDMGAVPLDDPEQVAEAYMQWEDTQSRPARHLSLRQRLQLKERTYCELVSARYIEVLWRWKFTRPFLYLKFPVV